MTKNAHFQIVLIYSLTFGVSLSSLQNFFFSFCFSEFLFFSYRIWSPQLTWIIFIVNTFKSIYLALFHFYLLSSFPESI